MLLFPLSLRLLITFQDVALGPVRPNPGWTAVRLTLRMISLKCHYLLAAEAYLLSLWLLRKRDSAVESPGRRLEVLKVLWPCRCTHAHHNSNTWARRPTRLEAFQFSLHCTWKCDPAVSAASSSPTSSSLAPWRMPQCTVWHSSTVSLPLCLIYEIWKSRVW